jgi:hypothetical protein
LKEVSIAPTKQDKDAAEATLDERAEARVAEEEGVESHGKVGSAPGGYQDTDWMLHYGGVPTDAQMDGYLAGIAASTNQKTIVAAAHKSGSTPHSLPIGKIKDILANNS